MIFSNLADVYGSRSSTLMPIHIRESPNMSSYPVVTPSATLKLKLLAEVCIKSLPEAMPGSQFLSKLSRYIPLWQRKVPHYPLYWKGNPQLRVFLPLFWMKLIKPEKTAPPDVAHFHVHHQMTVFDVKNYLEKIYDVKTCSVRTFTVRGKPQKAEKGYTVHPEGDTKVAVVKLADGQTFQWPDILKGKKTEEEKSVEDYKKLAKEQEKYKQKNWHRTDVPVWFR